MRVLFVTWAAPGHLYPMVPLAHACQAAGHQVRVAGPPATREAITSAGLPAVVTGTDVDLKKVKTGSALNAWDSSSRWPIGWPHRPEVLAAEETAALRAAAERQTVVAAEMLDDLLTFARWWRPDLVVSDPLCFAGPVAAAVLGVPNLAHGWEIGTVLRSEMLDRGDEFLPGYAELFHRAGVAPRRATATVVDPCPPGLRGADTTDVDRVPVRYQPYNGPGSVPLWLAEDSPRPRICVTSGVAIGKYDAAAGTKAFDEMVELVGDLDAEILLAGEADGQEELPGHVRRIGLVPFQLLLPSCAAVVHHGGTGTALCAVASGTPQIVVPRSPIYTEVARQVARSGAGLMLTGGSGTGEVTKALEDLLTTGTAARALGALAGELAAMPTPAEVAAGLADLASAARPPAGVVS